MTTVSILAPFFVVKEGETYTGVGIASKVAAHSVDHSLFRRRMHVCFDLALSAV